MPAGRPPKPLERKKVLQKGDGQSPGGHRRDNPGTAVAVRTPGTIAAPEPPQGLRERGSHEWLTIWGAGRSWLHPDKDYHWVEQIARAYDDIEDFRDEIANTGLIVKGYAGQKTANPLLKEIRALEATIRVCLSKLGFSPVDRAQLGLAEVQVQTGLRNLQDRFSDQQRRTPGR